MKRIFIFLVIFTLFSFKGYSYEVFPKALIRLAYISAATSQADCIKLIEYCEKNEISDPHFLLAYKACGMIVMAKHVLNPISKMAHFNKGKKLLEESIRKDPFNPELRYLRFSIQSNIPVFLNYNDEIQKDKLFLLNSISTMEDLQLKKLILQVLKKSEFLSSNEK